MPNTNNELYKRNLAVPFFTQRDNTYIWQFLAKCQKLKKTNSKTKQNLQIRFADEPQTV